MVNIPNLQPPMTKEEKEELYKNWTDESWKILAERNIHLALSVVKMFQNTNFDEDDLFGTASIGLVKAAKKFKPELGYEFSTFATTVIKNEILIEIRNSKRSVKCAASLDDTVNFGKDGVCELRDVIPSDFNIDDFIILAKTQAIIEECISEEKERNKNIIICFLNGIDQKENGRINGVSQTQVSRTLKKFKANLKGRIERWV